ncbi:MAG: hypothetical protein C0452_09335 [Pseudomonas sp.]|nr:hypothetical protein [Pseudomonas sp.]
MPRPSTTDRRHVCDLRPIPSITALCLAGGHALRACSKPRELEQCKAKTGEEAECTFVHEHSEPVFNAAVPTRSRL